MQHVRRLLTLVLLITCLTLVPEVVQAQDSGGQITHTVQAGENLYRISLRYGTTVTALSQANGITNPNMVYVGQVLIIPTTAVPPVATPMPTTLPGTPAVTPAPTATTPASTAEIVHVVQVGENLHRIALKYNTTSAAIASHNAIANPNLIYVGQSLRIPAAGAPAVTLPAEGGQPAQPGVTPAPADVPATPPPSAAANVGFAYGVQVHLPNQDMVMIANSAKNLGIVWVKQQIEWALYEPVQGAINWTPIDEMVDALAAQNFSIMLNVTSAPVGARFGPGKGSADRLPDIRISWARWPSGTRIAWPRMKSGTSRTCAVVEHAARHQRRQLCRDAAAGIHGNQDRGSHHHRGDRRAGANRVQRWCRMRLMIACICARCTLRAWRNGPTRSGRIRMGGATLRTAHAAATIVRRCPPTTIIRASSSKTRFKTTARSWFRTGTAARISGDSVWLGIE